MKKNQKISNLKKMRTTVGSWGDIDRRRLNAIIKFSGNKILDAGCANGSYVKALHKKGYEVLGCDILYDTHWKGKLRSKFKVADIYKLPYKNDSFDTLLLFDVLEHIKNIDKSLNEIHRVTKKNLILSVPFCDQPPEFKSSGLAFHHWIDRTHIHFFDENLITKTLTKNNFIIKSIQYIDPIMPETLFLTGWHIPLKIAVWIGKACQLLPFRKKYCMALLVVANKKRTNNYDN